jgi:hypothetical protein
MWGRTRHHGFEELLDGLLVEESAYVESAAA